MHDIDHDDIENRSANLGPEKASEFEKISERMLSRRAFLGTGIAFGGSAFVMGAAGSLVPRMALANGSASRFGFAPVAANSLDTITVPENYSWHVVASWGDPLWTAGKAFDQTSRGDGASQELAFGDNNDGMSLFMDGDHSVMAVNNEYVNRKIFHGNRDSATAETADDVRKSKAGHGVSIFEIELSGSSFAKLPKDSISTSIRMRSELTTSSSVAGSSHIPTSPVRFKAV